MDITSERCMCDHHASMEATTTTIHRRRRGVTVSVDGVPAMRCGACGEISITGKVGIPIDEAMVAILVATGAIPPPDPEVDAAPLDQPSGAKTSA